MVTDSIFGIIYRATRDIFVALGESGLPFGLETRCDAPNTSIVLALRDYRGLICFGMEST